MCTAVNLTQNYHFFGRNLDLHCDYGESALKVPVNYQLKFRHMGELKSKYSILGCGLAADGFPLYFDAMNSEGLCGAGLNFPRCASYRNLSYHHRNICSFEVIPYVLSQCKNISEAVDLLKSVNVTNDNFSESYPATPLHWIFGDKSASVIVEPLETGLTVTKATTGVLTNSPEYAFHENNLKRYPQLSPKSPNYPNAPLALGTESLPGGLTSEDRFVRASYFTSNSQKGTVGEERGSFISILSSVNVPRGAVLTEKDELHYTRYTSLYETDSKRLTYFPHGKTTPATVTLDRRETVETELETVNLHSCQI